MSRRYSAKNNDYKMQFEDNYEAYFEGPKEPRRHISAAMMAEIDDELQKNTSRMMMRQEFRRLARRMRNRMA